jgi:MFS family permease
MDGIRTISYDDGTSTLLQRKDHSNTLFSDEIIVKEEVTVSTVTDLDNDHKPWRRPRLLMIVFPSLLYFLVLFIMTPICIQLTLRIVCNQTQDGEDCSSASVSSEAARIGLITSLINNIPSFIVNGLYQSISDRYGRKVVLVLPMVGHILYCAILLALCIYQTHISINNMLSLLVAASLLQGCSGSFPTFQMASFAYAADLTKERSGTRGVVYSTLESALFFAKTVGPLCGGLYSNAYGFRDPIMFCLCLSTIGCIWCLFCIQEDKQIFPDKSKKISYDPLKTISNAAMILGFDLKFVQSENEEPDDGDGDDGDGTHKTLLGTSIITDVNMSTNGRNDDPYPEKKDMHQQKYRRCSGMTCSTSNPLTPVQLPYLSFAYFVYFACYYASYSISILYMTHRFNANPAFIGIYEAYEGLLQCISILLVPMIIEQWLGAYIDIYWLYIGYFMRALYFACFGFVDTKMHLFAVTPVILLAATVTPRTRTLISNSVPHEIQSQVMSGFAALQSASTFISPLICYVYSVIVFQCASCIYYLFGLIVLVASLMILYLIINKETRQIVVALSFLNKKQPIVGNGKETIETPLLDEEEDC